MPPGNAQPMKKKGQTNSENTTPDDAERPGVVHETERGPPHRPPDAKTGDETAAYPENIRRATIGKQEQTP
jgi:hypothetical protein